MRIVGYVICSPINTWGDTTKSQWWPHDHTFGRTALEAWILFLKKRPEDDDWDRVINNYVDRGYCPKKATMDIEC